MFHVLRGSTNILSSVSIRKGSALRVEFVCQKAELS